MLFPYLRKEGGIIQEIMASVVGKLLEKILRDRIYAHLEENGLVSDRQHGFIWGRSCLTNLIEFF